MPAAALSAFAQRVVAEPPSREFAIEMMQTLRPVEPDALHAMTLTDVCAIDGEEALRRHVRKRADDIEAVLPVWDYPDTRAGRAARVRAINMVHRLRSLADYWDECLDALRLPDQSAPDYDPLADPRYDPRSSSYAYLPRRRLSALVSSSLDLAPYAAPDRSSFPPALREAMANEDARRMSLVPVGSVPSAPSDSRWKSRAARRARISENLRLESLFTIYTKLRKIRAVARRLTASSKAEFMPRLFPGWVPGRRQYDAADKAFLRHLSTIQSLTRKQMVEFRVVQAAQWARENGWFVLFASLTADNAHYSHSEWSFSQKRLWEYLRRAVGEELGLSASESTSRAWREQLVRYFLVPEQGGKTGREHSHAVVLLRALPRGCQSDPNAGRAVPYYREISGFKRFWGAGFSSWQMFRTDGDDPWGRKGFVWPVIPVGKTSKLSSWTGAWRPLDASPPAVVASYLSDYLKKQFSPTGPTEGTKRWRRRISYSRSFGKDYLRETISRLSEKQTLVLIESPHLARIHARVPRRLLLQESLRRYRSLVGVNSWRMLVRKVQARESIFRLWLAMKEAKPHLPVGERLPTIGSISTLTSADLGVSDEEHARLRAEVANEFLRTESEHPLVKGALRGSVF